VSDYGDYAAIESFTKYRRTMIDISAAINSKLVIKLSEL